MRYSSDHKKESRGQLLAATGRGFRKRGYGGIGVDGLAKEGHVTSGAFYGHFGSKDEAFKETLTEGLDEFEHGVEQLQVELGSAWLPAFIDFYMDFRRTCDLSESCALQSLTVDVIRGTNDIKERFEERVQKIAMAIAIGLTGGSQKDREDRAYALLSILSGGVTMARAVTDQELSAKMAAAVKSAALLVAG
jgi:TetR/AcrR family transcriptional regulator, transcriptional repressor for nem operon